jgi:PilZ domain
MNNSFPSVATAIPAPSRAVARIAFIELKDPARDLLADCFQQFGAKTIAVTGDITNRLRKEKFDACVLKLAPGAEGVMEFVRTSPSNSRMVIYGLGGDAREALRYSKYGINAIFHEPLERPAALKLVRATQALVFHEFRRYIRIPVITEVSVTTSEGAVFAATSQEISSGGMSLRGAEAVSAGESVEISFALLTLPRIWVRSTVTWRKTASRTFGIRFDSKDERRYRIKEWIDAYLEN